MDFVDKSGSGINLALDSCGSGNASTASSEQHRYPIQVTVIDDLYGVVADHVSKLIMHGLINNAAQHGIVSKIGLAMATK